MPTRALLSSAGVFVVAVLLWYSGALPASWGRLPWALLLLLGFAEGLAPRPRQTPRLSTAIALLFGFRLLQPPLGQLLFVRGFSSSAAGSLSYLLVASALSLLAFGALRRAPWPREMRLITALGLGLAGGVVSALVLVSFLWGVPTQTKAFTPPDLYWLLGLFWVAAPLWEELCFRGLLFRSLHELSGQRAWSSVCVSAALFALMHEGALLPPIFALGVISATLYLRTRTLIAPMLVHLLHNMTAWHLGAF
jgi:membrane protease YdiL (CAAX protease family)